MCVCARACVGVCIRAVKEKERESDYVRERERNERQSVGEGDVRDE